jgi:CheY-like chemotaxis protein
MFALPVVDGLMAVWEIREEETSRKLTQQHVIALTWNAREAQIEQAMKVGTDAGMVFEITCSISGCCGATALSGYQTVYISRFGHRNV